MIDTFKQFKNSYSFKNRGMFLEDLINKTNQYYLDNDIAVIYKKPIPIHIVKINSNNKIIEAYFEKASTSDYNGIYKGKYIDFEAKCTTLRTSFPLSNLTENEFNHLKKVYKHGGISFIIIYFSELDEYYIYEIKNLLLYLSENKRKSIPYDEIKTNGFLISFGLKIPLNYIEIIDLLYFNLPS